MTIYLDYASTTPLFKSVREKMIAALENTGNPSSIHTHGRHARSLLESSRRILAKALNVANEQIIFTSGGTEATGLIMHCFPASQRICSVIEHPSVRHWVPQAQQVAVDENGVLCLRSLRQKLQDIPCSILAVMAGNNEVGTYQPLPEIVATFKGLAPQKNQGTSTQTIPWLHVDGMQTFGKAPFDFEKTGWDSFALSAHKIGGPQGVGALIVKSTRMQEMLDFQPLMQGGGQEKGRRNGTPNLSGIVGFGQAVSEIFSVPWSRIEQLRQDLETRLLSHVPGVRIHGAGARRLPHISCISHPTLAGAEQVIALDLAGISVSAGAACSSGKMAQSSVLAAMAEAAPQHHDLKIDNMIRVSLGWETTAADIDAFVTTYVQLAKTLTDNQE